MWKEKAASRNYEARDDFSDGGDERRDRKPSVEKACREKNRMQEKLQEQRDAGETCFIPNSILVLHEACHVALEPITLLPQPSQVSLQWKLLSEVNE